MSSAMVGNGYQQNYNTYNGQPAPNQGQNVQDGYHEPHPSSRPPANEQQYYSSSPSQPQSVQTSPRRGVFYRLVSPEVGLPLGRYEERRKSLDDQRQRDYFAMMSQKEKMEQQKRQEEKMKKQAHAQKLHMQQPEQGLYNYDEVQRNLREERRKDYGEFVKFKEEQSKIKPAPTPPGGLDVGQNDLYRQHLKEDLVKEYQASLKKKEQNPSPRRMPTPPHGLDIVSQSERTRQAREKQRQYGQELQKENIPDIHLESYRKNPFEENRRGERNREYNEFLSQKEVKAQSKREQIDNLRRQPAVQPKFDKYASSDSHQQHRKQLESELRDQYQSFLSQSYSREPQHEYSRKGPELGLPLDNKKSNELRRRQEKDRNQEYRSFLEEKKRSPRRYHPPTPEDKQGLPLTQRPYDEMKAINEKQRNMEYNQYLAKNHTRYWNMLNEKKKGEVPRRQGDPSMDEKNMFSDLGKSQDAHKKKIHENAKQDYRNYVDHAFPEGLNRGEPTFAARKAPPDSWYDAQPPTHRRSPPRDYRPDQENHQRHNHDAYAERLDQARANEALYRKHDHQMNDHGHRQPPPSQAQAPYALY